MKSKFKYMALLLLLPLAYSCIFDEDVPVVEEDRDPVMVTFTLDAMSSAATKADDYNWGGNYPTVAPDDFENKILTTDLMVIAYDTGGNFIAELPVILCT